MTTQSAVWRTLVCLAGLAVALPAAAPAEVVNDAANSKQNTEGRIEESTTPAKASLFGVDDSLYQSHQAWKRQLKEKTGLDLALESTTIYQIATGSREANDAIETTNTLFGTWTMWQSPNKIDALGVGFAVENRVNYNGDSFVDMTADLGTVWAPNDATSDDYTKITQLWFGQRMAEGKFTYIVGKIDPTSYINGNRFAGSTNTQFFGQPLATNPARTFAENGIGTVARFAPVPWFQLQACLSDGNAVSNHSPFTTIRGDWFKAAEVVFIPKVPNLGEGRYRFMVYQQDRETFTTNGWALSFDQNLGDDWGVFFRYGGNEGDVNAISQLVSGGVSWLKPFGRKDDQAGIGLSYTHPADPALRDEYSTEIFYRLQATSFMEFSASMQAVFNPSASNEDVLGIVGVRMRLLF